jgi:hypothetical protein
MPVQPVIRSRGRSVTGTHGTPGRGGRDSTAAAWSLTFTIVQTFIVRLISEWRASRSYTGSRRASRPCPRRSNCPTEFRKRAPNKRYVRRSLCQDLFEEVQARMEKPEFRKRLSERMWKSEGLFAEAKQNHGLSRVRYRGRSKVQIQAYLSAMAQNLNRLVFLFYLRLAIRRLYPRRLAA